MIEEGINYNVSVEPPSILNSKNVIYWNEEYKRLEGVTEASAIRTKAKKWLENNCIVYSERDQCFICKNIKGYNKTFHKIRKVGDNFECSCQFHNKIVKENLTHLMCSHVLAVKLQISIWKHNNSSWAKL